MIGSVFGIGKKFCYTCGMEVSGNQYQRFGKYFCSEEHAQQYTEQMQKSRQEQLATAQQTKSSDQCGGC
ncbi:MAG: hypothetical protein LYZ69_01750 [Nitrososphaerales archaeon]|nr:hypothetical protein [Nitrososphaerales archaeon]